MSIFNWNEALRAGKAYMKRPPRQEIRGADKNTDELAQALQERLGRLGKDRLKGYNFRTDPEGIGAQYKAFKEAKVSSGDKTPYVFHAGNKDDLDMRLAIESGMRRAEGKLDKAATEYAASPEGQSKKVLDIYEQTGNLDETIGRVQSELGIADPEEAEEFVMWALRD